MPTDDIVVLKEVRKSFGDAEVLKGIDLVCRRNETTCVVGGSGAGKTTLLRLIVALDKPTSGHIYVDGEDTVPLGEHTKLSAAERRTKVLDKLKALGLDESVLRKYPSELSGGMRKRVGLA